jgi:hypothetical protein
VRALRDRITLQSDDTVSTIAAAVKITTTDGEVHQLTQPAARGSDANPLLDSDLENKLRSAAADWNSAFDPGPLIAAIWTLDRSDDVSKLVAMAT